MEAGPLIVTRAQDLVWVLLVAMFVANLFIFLLG